MAGWGDRALHKTITPKNTEFMEVLENAKPMPVWDFALINLKVSDHFAIFHDHLAMGAGSKLLIVCHN